MQEQQLQVQRRRATNSIGEHRQQGAPDVGVGRLCISLLVRPTLSFLNEAEQAGNNQREGWHMTECLKNCKYFSSSHRLYRSPEGPVNGTDWHPIVPHLNH